MTAREKGSAPQTEAFRVPLIGLLLERKTDILAAAAFLMALVGALAQLYYLWVGARVTLFAPEQVVMTFQELPDGRHLFRIGARMAYVNTGRPGYNATLRKETVSFQLGNKTFLHTWQSERQFSDAGEKLRAQYIAEARPIPITAGGSVSREIYFAPWPERCRMAQKNCDRDRQYLFEDDAIRLLATTPALKLTFSSSLFGDDEPLTVSCTVEISPAVMSGLMRKGWAAPPCWS